MNISAKLLLLPVFLFSVFSNAQNSTPLKTGKWQGELLLNGTTHLPFYFEIKKSKDKLTIEISNAEEKIVVDDIQAGKDSVKFKMPLFDSEFLCEIKDDGKSLDGVWINHMSKTNNEIPFLAYKGRHYECEKSSPAFEILQSGPWEVTFNPNAPESYRAIGLFKFDKDEHKVTGTFLTETGDFRYLSGFACMDWIYMSCFDGSHAWYFRWKLRADNTLAGDFFSGTQGYEPWIAKRNDHVALGNPDSLTFLKKKEEKLDFKFKNLDGQDVSLNDARYQNKVVIIQIMGSWCPNCMDETKYLADLYKQDKDRGLEIIALAFERGDDPEKVNQHLKSVKTHFGADYEFLIAGKTGSTEAASAALPMLNAVMAFPTTIIVDKKGMVQKVYTGFNGPATGVHYEQYKTETAQFLDKLLK
jgi:peroxiredoxin